MATIRIRTRLLLIILLTAILPVLVVTSFTVTRSFRYLEEQTRDYYANLLRLVGDNVDFVYEQQTSILEKLSTRMELVNGLKAPPYSTLQEELAVSHGITGREDEDYSKRTFRESLEETLEGGLFIYELDRKSLVDKTDYKIHRVYAENFVTYARFEKMMEDPLFIDIRNNREQKHVLGKFQEGVLTGTSSDTSVIIQPLYLDNYDRPFKKFILVIFFPSLLDKFYNNLPQLRYGTLYILDHMDNIITYNHPGGEDYYEYDEEHGHYLLGDDDPDDPFEKMSFREYRMLNTDFEILKIPEVVGILSELSLHSNKEQTSASAHSIIIHDGQPYLVIGGLAPRSRTRMIYFHPIGQIYGPLITIIIVVLSVMLGMILVIIFFSIFISRTFTRPIETIVTATKTISEGNYNNLVTINTGDELSYLASNFNNMIRNIKAFHDKLTTAEREKTEMEIANKIQSSLVPAMQNWGQYEISGSMIPAEQVGGDYLDLIISEVEDRLWIIIGDVSGHGMGAGLIMMMAQTAFNTILLNNPKINTEDLVQKVNRVLYQNIKKRLAEDDFMTISCCVIDKNGTVHYSGAHLDILIYRKATGNIELFETDGIWMGIIPDISPKTKEHQFVLEKGDVMVLYTDGLTEAPNIDLEMYDIERLVKKFGEHAERPVKEIENEILGDVFDFMEEQLDDITLFVMRRR